MHVQKSKVGRRKSFERMPENVLAAVAWRWSRRGGTRKADPSLLSRRHDTCFHVLINSETKIFRKSSKYMRQEMGYRMGLCIMYTALQIPTIVHSCDS
jgi:hypothetical protein